MNPSLATSSLNTVKRRICFVLPSLQAGGAQISLCTLVRELTRRGYEIDIVVGRPVKSVAEVKFEGAVSVHHLGVHNFGVALIADFFRLRAMLARLSPTLIVGFLDIAYIACLLAGVGIRDPVITCERATAQCMPYGFALRLLRRAIYWRASAAVVVSRDGLDDLPLGAPKLRRVLPGPIDPPSTSATCLGQQARRKSIVALGRLSPEKSFPTLIAAFSLIAGDFPDWNLEIYGEGPQREHLLSLVASFPGLRERVALPGFVGEPYQVLSTAGVFVLCSESEGFPRALAEAMMCGVPSIATNCPGASTEMISNGVNGILIPSRSSTELAGALCLLLSEPSLRDRLGRAALGVRLLCATELIVPKWEKLFADVLERKF